MPGLPEDTASLAGKYINFEQSLRAVFIGFGMSVYGIGGLPKGSRENTSSGIRGGEDIRLRRLAPFGVTRHLTTRMPFPSSAKHLQKQGSAADKEFKVSTSVDTDCLLLTTLLDLLPASSVNNSEESSNCDSSWALGAIRLRFVTPRRTCNVEMCP